MRRMRGSLRKGDEWRVEAGQVALNAGDASLWHLFWQASPLVQVVMVGLIAASVICWAIVIEKVLVINRLMRATDRFEGMFWSGQSLEDLCGPSGLARWAA